MTLDQITIDKLKSSVGTMRVKSLCTGKQGYLVYVSDKPDREDYNIEIQWDHGPKSFVWHFDAVNIEEVNLP